MATKVDVIEVVRHGEQLLVPQSMTLKRAVEVLQRQMEYEEQQVSIIKTFDVFPWDGALALYRVLDKRFGFVDAQTQVHQSFFGSSSEPPEMINVKCGVKETVDVPWGQFKIPGIDGVLETGTAKNNRGQRVFSFKATVKPKHSQTIEKIAEDTRQYLLEHSIYRGKAIKPAFDDSDSIEDIEFVDLSKVKPELLVFPDASRDRVISGVRTHIQLDVSGQSQASARLETLIAPTVSRFGV